MKVLHVITSLQVGGAERLMVDLLPRFKKEGIDDIPLNEKAVCLVAKLWGKIRFIKFVD